MLETILILAPFGRDAELSSSLLEKEGFKTRVLENIREVDMNLIQNAGALLMTEEALGTEDYTQLEKKLAAQDTWSDLPIVLLVSNDNHKKSHRLLEHFSREGNITLLERPFHLITLITSINVALRARKRQYQVKELLKQQEISLRTRDEFLSIASHELKTPITTLKLQVQMRRRFLKKGDDSVYEKEKVNMLIDTTEHQVNRLERLVDDMLDISRIENGKLNLHLEEFDLGEVVKKTYQSLSDVFSNAKCQVTMTIDDGIVGLWDRYRIEQAILNLFTNAIKYGRGCPVNIDVRAVDGLARLVVKDNGMGIAKADQARIFQRFERAVEGGNISGLGLGLFITKEILEMQGGSIEVTSDLNRGSIFTVHLPLKHKLGKKDERK